MEGSASHGCTGVLRAIGDTLRKIGNSIPAGSKYDIIFTKRLIQNIGKKAEDGSSVSCQSKSASRVPTLREPSVIRRYSERILAMAS